MIRRGLIAAAVACVVGCAAHRPQPKPLTMDDYPGVLVSPAEQKGDYLRRQQLVAKYQGKTQSFEAVLQKKGDTLTLIGLTPFGSKAFVLEQKGTEVTFTPYLHREMPFPPQFILNDVQRTYFQGITEGPLADGTHQVERDGERITEQWSGGRLQERRFARLKNDPPGEIVIRYVGGMADSRSPELIEFTNGWLGYQLTIKTVSETAL